MKDIKYRGLEMDDEGKWFNGRWVYGLLSISQGCKGQPLPGYYISNSAGMPWAFRILPESLGQYIGLRDKQKTEIFEDDIIMGDNGGVAEVGYVPNHFSLYPEDVYKSDDKLIDEMRDGFNSPSATPRDILTNIEVIGNGHDGFKDDKYYEDDYKPGVKMRKPDSRFTFEKGFCPLMGTEDPGRDEYCIGPKCELWNERGCSFRVGSITSGSIAGTLKDISGSLNGIEKVLIQILGQLKTRK